MADLSSILGGMVQGFKDFGTGLVDFFGTGAANIGDIATSIATGRATTKNQDDFRKWLYQTDDKQDAAAKGLGTILNGVSTVADVMPGAQAVTANPLFNGLQGAIGGVSDELKMAGKDADWGRAAQRAGVGAASGLASGYAGQGLAKTGNKLLSNGLTRGAVSGALGGGIANAGYTGIEGGSVQDMINAGLYGAQTGALVGGTTGLARELIKPTHKMDVALTDEEKAARIANIDDQLGKLDTTTPEGNARYAELTAARENYEPKTYYHGSPETDITEFDINRAGKNTRSGEKAIYFTDTPEAAEEFAYERIPTDSIFMDKVGKRGGVYEANLDMRNTLDLDNLTDAQIRELWNYASPLGQLDGQEAFVQRLTDWRDKYHNPQLTKGYIDLEALRNSPYDSFSATMYPNTDNKAREYAIFDASKAKITKSPKTVADIMNEPKQKTVADLMLSPEQEEFFKGSVVRDENGNLLPMYHGSNSKFTVFDASKGGKSNKTAKVGHWFTPSKEAAEKWAGQAWWGDNEPSVYETYLNIKKPMVYEAVDNSVPIKKLEAQLKQAKDRLDSTYRGSQEYYDAYREYNNIANEIDNLSYTDPYEQFRSHIYAMEGKTPSQANAGGVGMAMNDEDAAVKKYVDMLKSEGYDGIIIKGTGYDQKVMGGPNDQYVVFDSNQIKDVNNLRPTADADIMYSKIPEGQLGLFDQPMPTKPVEEALMLDGEYSPKDNKVTKAMRARAEEIMGDYKTSKKVPENELYNKIDESTLPNKRKSTGAILDDLYSKGVKPDEVSNKVIDQLVEKEIGGQMDKKSLAKYLFGDMDDTARKDFIKKNLYTTKDYDVDDLTESILKNWARRKAMASGTLNKYNIDNLAIVGGNKTVRQGYTGALDSALSERLGIAPGNTYKQNGEFDTPGALGRYIGSESRPDFNNYMVKEVPDIEEALNTAGHERLHSFQAESRLENRYSKEVADAYNGLASDLKKANAYKSDAEIKNRYKKGTEYWGDTDEQEARMLQQYLGARGFTDYNKRDAKMYGALEFDNDKIVPAFDKFFDKLRALSKKGVALPALTALFGGGAIMAATQSDDKKKKSEVK